MATYTLHILLIECIRAQETDGDEIYLTLDGQTIWRAAPDAMIQTPLYDDQISAFDFANARKHARDGWRNLADVPANSLTFTGLDSEKQVQIWDADTDSVDDVLGTATVSIHDDGRGLILLVFEHEDAEYNLTYRVEADA